MKPDWDALGDEYADSKTVVIGDVDCTAAGKPLCEKYGVRGCAPPARPSERARIESGLRTSVSGWVS